MNKFIIHSTPKLSPEETVRMSMGIGIDELIEAIKENRNGEYDRLYKNKKQNMEAQNA